MHAHMWWNVSGSNGSEDGREIERHCCPRHDTRSDSEGAAVSSGVREEGLQGLLESLGKIGGNDDH